MIVVLTSATISSDARADCVESYGCICPAPFVQGLVVGTVRAATEVLGDAGAPEDIVLVIERVGGYMPETSGVRVGDAFPIVNGRGYIERSLSVGTRLFSVVGPRRLFGSTREGDDRRVVANGFHVLDGKPFDCPAGHFEERQAVELMMNPDCRALIDDRPVPCPGGPGNQTRSCAVGPLHSPEERSGAGVWTLVVVASLGAAATRARPRR